MRITTTIRRYSKTFSGKRAEAHTSRLGGGPAMGDTTIGSTYGCAAILVAQLGSRLLPSFPSCPPFQTFIPSPSFWLQLNAQLESRKGKPEQAHLPVYPVVLLSHLTP